MKLTLIYLIFLSNFTKLKFVSYLAQLVLTYCLPDFVKCHIFLFDIIRIIKTVFE